MHLGTKRTTPTASLLALLVCLSLLLVSGGGTGAATAASSAGSTAASGTKTTVAHTLQGRMASKIEGTTANGRTVTGYFTPLHFLKKDGKVKARGLLNMVVHNADGSSRTYAAMRTLRVKSVNGTPTSTGLQAAASCDILHLVLAPLDLDLLGLQVHLDRVVLDVVAKSGSGNLLGNLLCAVTGLLDGGLGGQLGKLTGLLNDILDALGLGV